MNFLYTFVILVFLGCSYQNEEGIDFKKTELNYCLNKNESKNLQELFQHKKSVFSQTTFQKFNNDFPEECSAEIGSPSFFHLKTNGIFQEPERSVLKPQYSNNSCSLTNQNDENYIGILILIGFILMYFKFHGPDKETSEDE
jgi:hypothetical protein